MPSRCQRSLGENGSFVEPRGIEGAERWNYLHDLRVVSQNVVGGLERKCPRLQNKQHCDKKNNRTPHLRNRLFLVVFHLEDYIKFIPAPFLNSTPDDWLTQRDFPASRTPHFSLFKRIYW